MTPLPGALAPDQPLTGWRLDPAKFAATWDSGEGARRFGGRWSSRGRRVVYASFEPSTTILEVAVHKGFAELDLSPHVLTRFTIREPADIHVVHPDVLPNPHWLHPATPSAGQQAYGDALLSRHVFLAAPSVVSARSWNLIFDAERAIGAYSIESQEPFALDPRLHPPEP